MFIEDVDITQKSVEQFFDEVDIDALIDSIALSENGTKKLMEEKIVEIKLESNGVCLSLSTLDKEKNIEFKTLVKAYEIVTGDELEITENTTEKNNHPTVTNSFDDNQGDYDRIPEYHQPVKVDLMCPWCGNNEETTTLFGNHFMKCPKCENKVFLAFATSRRGVPDHRGFYYKANELWRDYEDRKVDDDLIDQMKSKVEEHNA